MTTYFCTMMHPILAQLQDKRPYEASLTIVPLNLSDDFKLAHYDHDWDAETKLSPGDTIIYGSNGLYFKIYYLKR